MTTPLSRPSGAPAPEAEAAAYAGKRLLVTGAAGYIGTTLLRLMQGVDCQVRATVAPESLERVGPSLVALGPRATEVVGSDIRTIVDFAPLLDGIDVVIHLAAQTSHYEANAHPEADWAINVAPILRLLGWCREHGAAPRVVFASSATVVGMPKALPVDEQAPCSPLTVYDIHKLCSEQYLSYFSSTHGIPSCSLRLANVYGSSAGTSKPDRGIVNSMVKRALAREDLTVYGSGDWLRDYVHLSDVAKAFLRAGSAPSANIAGRSFNICSGVGTRFRDVLALIRDEAAKATSHPSRIVHVDKTLLPIDERSFIGNHDAFTAATGWTPQIDLRSGIVELVAAGRTSGSGTRIEP